MKTGVADMDPDRTQKVEQLGFEWWCRTIRNAAASLSPERKKVICNLVQQHPKYQQQPFKDWPPGQCPGQSRRRRRAKPKEGIVMTTANKGRAAGAKSTSFGRMG
jgi:hypothetical protein